MVYPLLLFNFLFCVVNNWYCNFILLGITYLLKIWMNYWGVFWGDFFLIWYLMVHLTIVCVNLSTFMDDEYEWLTDWWLVRNVHTHLKGTQLFMCNPPVYKYNYICLNCENKFLILKNMLASFFVVAKLFEFHIILYRRVIICFCSWNFMKRKKSIENDCFWS